MQINVATAGTSRILVICKLVLGTGTHHLPSMGTRSSRFQVNFARTEQSFGKPVDKKSHVGEGGGTGLKRLKGFGGENGRISDLEGRTFF